MKIHIFIDERKNYTYTHINMNIEDFQTTKGSGNQCSMVIPKCFSLVYRLKENIFK